MTASSEALSRRTVVAMFLSFALAYFFSALLRAVIATLAPAFSAELQLSAADLGLLAGAFFLGFASTQLPLGSALDRLGPKRVQLALLSTAVIGCGLFASAGSFATLISARVLIGMGVSACLMAPLTSFRRYLTPKAQMRATSWMLMTGSSGMVASTLPVQWILPVLGWRGLFWLLAVCLVMSMVVLSALTPSDVATGRTKAPRHTGTTGSYADVFRNRTFIRYLPMGLFHFGGMLALQSLWIGPWLSRVGGDSPQMAAQGLFLLNIGMLLAFLSWGALTPRLVAKGWTAQALIRRCTPLSLGVLVLAIVLGEDAGALAWTLFCVSSTVVTLTLPTIGQAFGASQAGRALSAFNLVIFGGVFALQWGIGGLIDLLEASGWATTAAFRGAFGALAVGCIVAYLWFLWFKDAPQVQPHIEDDARSGDNSK